MKKYSTPSANVRTVNPIRDQSRLSRFLSLGSRIEGSGGATSIINGVPRPIDQKAFFVNILTRGNLSKRIVSIIGLAVARLTKKKRKKIMDKF